MRAIIACAGTGGHINPGLAIANYIMKESSENKILFIGTFAGLENELVSKAGFEIKNIRAGRLIRKISIKNIKNMKNAFLGIKDARNIIQKFNPDIVIGTGGYVSFPVMKAAIREKIPYVLHESNAFPGLAVRIAALKAAKVLTGFESTIERLPKKTKAVFTGTPTKFNIESYMKLDKEVCKKELNLTDAIDNKKILFVTGGSQGAKKINDTVINMVKKYKSNDFFVVLATGIKNYEETIQEIKCENLDKYLKLERYIYDMDKMYKASDILLTRAGAMTITEISIIKRPSILVPLPSAAGNHQFFNAKALEDLGAGIIIDEAYLNEKLLYDKINMVILNEENSSIMGENAYKLYIPNVELKIMKEINQVLRGKQNE